MENLEDLMNYTEREETFNLKEFLYKLTDKWHWFLIAVFAGALLSFLVNRFMEPVYEVESTVLVEEASRGQSSGNLFEGAEVAPTFSIQNHIGFLKSFTLNQQVLENLNWRVSWYKKELFIRRGIYKNEPFRISENDPADNLEGIFLTVTPLSDKTFLVTADGEATENGTTKKIGFNNVGYFGRPFKNEYFRFTLDKIDNKAIETGVKYVIVFNDINKQTLEYQEKLNVNLTDPLSQLIRVVVKGKQPEKEVDYLNELTRVFVQFGLDEKNRTSKKAIQFIESQLEGVADSLKTAGKSFTNYRSRRGIVDLGQESGLLVQKMESLESEKATTEMRILYYKSLKGYLNNSKNMSQVVAPSVVGITDPSLSANVLKLSELYRNREVLSFSVKEKNPSMRNIENEIIHTRKSLEENLDNLLSNAQIEVRSLRQRIARINSQLMQLPKTEEELGTIKSRFELNNELYTFMLKKRAEAAILEASNIADAKVFDPAHIDTARKVGPTALFIYLFGVIFGLAIPLLYIVISDYFNDTIQSKEEVEKITDLPILGSIVHRTYHKELVVVDYPRSCITESFRAIRTNLRFMLAQDMQKVIGIHSIIPNEGKSVTSTNLAAIMAVNNKKVLLVGADLRKPRLHEIFGVDNDKGLSSYLVGRCRFKEIVKESKVKGLSIIPSGPLPPNPVELLENGSFERFISEAREQFDYIILDNPPVSYVTDGVLTAVHADVNLFLLREGYSNKEQVKFINKFAEKKTITRIALIINDSKRHGLGYRNGFGGYTNERGSGYYDERKVANKRK
jgi:capsular exopolysaccharide synthesis family protein